jgi:hypothetical protein
MQLQPKHALIAIGIGALAALVVLGLLVAGGIAWHYFYNDPRAMILGEWQSQSSDGEPMYLSFERNGDLAFTSGHGRARGKYRLLGDDRLELEIQGLPFMNQLSFVGVTHFSFPDRSTLRLSHTGADYLTWRRR